jgi:acid phosphatase type 7
MQYRLIPLLWLLITSTLAAQSTQPATTQFSSAVLKTFTDLDESLRKTLPPPELIALTDEKIIARLTAGQRKVLGTDYLTFDVNVPVELYVMSITDRPPPFWFEDQEFERTAMHVQVETRKFNVWHKRHDAGTVGLGIATFDPDAPQHYWIIFKPQDAQAKLEVTNLPPRAKLGVATKGERIFVERTQIISELPAELEGAVLLRPYGYMGAPLKLVGKYRVTKFPSSEKPDHIVLTWSDDPETTQTIQWRTSTKIESGRVSYVDKEHAMNLGSIPVEPAKTIQIEEPTTLNDPVIHWHTVTLRNLKPDTEYVYNIGGLNNDPWSGEHSFRTAPREPQPFTFVYLGDAQNGLNEWGALMKDIHQRHPEVKFYLLAGDLIESGNQRDNWDEFFAYPGAVFAERPLVPVLGNHEYVGDGDRYYQQFFTLPNNGPKELRPGQAHALRYGNALIVSLDSNRMLPEQAAWLDQTLAVTDARWKFVAYHHPAYSGTAGETNPMTRQHWSPIFDKHWVQFALQGHVHAYFRSKPIRDGKVVEKGGTIYTVAISGTKMYPSKPTEFTQVTLENTRTYQLITVEAERVIYRAFDVNHKQIDEVIVER